MEKLIITAALTGAEVTRELQPNLPLTPDEIAEAAYQCYLTGASVVHVHARDAEGKPTQDYETYKVIKEKIAEKCNIIFQPSTGGAVWHSAEERMQPIELSPEMATLSTGTTNFGHDVFINTEEYIIKFANRIKELGVKPEIECFERGMINTALNLAKKGIINYPIHFDFVLGVPGACPGEVRDLLHMIGSIPKDSTWTVAGIGRYEIPLATVAIIEGGHVRVGFEDNIFVSKGVLAKSNAQLVGKVVRLAKELGREIATPDEARKILGINK